MLMLYFSGTGNSEYIAREFAQKMQAGCHSIEEKADFARLLAETDTVAVCYPIYGSCVPRIMREFVKKYEAELQKKKLIIFCTQMLFSGDGAKAFVRLLPGCEKRVIYAEHFLMPNNLCNVPVFPMRDSELIRKPARAKKKLERVCREIQNGVVRKRGWNWFSCLLGKSQNIAYPKMETQGRGSFLADEDCVLCGVCVKQCPMGNLEIKDGRLIQKNNCTLCYRCVNLCPKQAATVYIHRKPRKQFRGIGQQRKEGHV